MWAAKTFIFGTKLVGFTSRIFDVPYLHFDIHIAQTRKDVVVFGPVLDIQGLGGPVEVASNDYFACLDVTHLD